MSLVDPGMIAYGFGAVFGILAVVYFARDILLSLSVTSKLALLYAISLSLLAVGVSGEATILSLIAFVVGGAGYAVSSFYFVKWYNRQRMGRFVISAASAILFVCLGWLISSGVTARFRIELAGAVSVTLIGATVALAIVDWNEGDVIQYQVIINETTESNTDQIGSVEVTNESVLFRHAFELPSFHCVVREGKSEHKIPVIIGSVIESGATSTIGANEVRGAPIQINWRAVEKQLEELEVSSRDSYGISVVGERAHKFTVEEGETINLELSLDSD